MLQETAKFLELELNRDTIPCTPPEDEEALSFSLEGEMRKVS
jgi:hypothetical protein